MKEHLKNISIESICQRALVGSLFPTFDTAKLISILTQKSRKLLYHSICGEVGECSGNVRGKQRGTIAVLALMLGLFLMHLLIHGKSPIVFDSHSFSLLEKFLHSIFRISYWYVLLHNHPKLQHCI